MEIFAANTGVIFFQLFIAVVLGALIGIERVMARKTAGMRTYALVSMGACLFIILSEYIGRMVLGGSFQPMQVPAAIITGIGFLGAGMILFKDDKLSGLTTAAGLWVTCGVGMAVGFKLYGIAFSATLLTLFIFIVLWFLEDALKRSSFKIFTHHKDDVSQM